MADRAIGPQAVDLQQVLAGLPPETWAADISAALFWFQRTRILTELPHFEFQRFTTLIKQRQAI
jgi:hypothetical protein